ERLPQRGRAFVVAERDERIGLLREERVVPAVSGGERRVEGQRARDGGDRARGVTELQGAGRALLQRVDLETGIAPVREVRELLEPRQRPLDAALEALDAREIAEREALGAAVAETPRLVEHAQQDRARLARAAGELQAHGGLRAPGERGGVVTL